MISPRINIFHDTIYSLDFDDEPEVTERHTSVADAKALMSTPTEPIAALNAYSLQLSRLKSTNIQPYTYPEVTVVCSPYDFHIACPRDDTFFENLCERPSAQGHFARIMNRLQIPHLLSPPSPNELENNLDLVHNALLRSPERSAPTPPHHFHGV